MAKAAALLFTLSISKAADKTSVCRVLGPVVFIFFSAAFADKGLFFPVNWLSLFATFFNNSCKNAGEKTKSNNPKSFQHEYLFT